MSSKSQNKKDSRKMRVSVESEGFLDLKPDELKKRLEECQKERDEYLAGWQRARADFINAKKEEEGVRKEARELAEEAIFARLLSVVDSFESALNDPEWQNLDKNWKNGIKFIYNQLLSVFEEYKIIPIEAKGEKFDPEVHEAVEEIEVDKKELDGRVLEEVRKGYKINDKVLRASLVKVGKHKDTNKN